MSGPAQGELLAPELSFLCPWGGRAGMLYPLGDTNHSDSALRGSWACHVRVAPLGAGWGMVGSSPHHPCSVWFVFFTLGPCLSAPPQPEALLPAWNRPPLKDWPLAHLS